MIKVMIIIAINIPMKFINIAKMPSLNAFQSFSELIFALTKTT